MVKTTILRAAALCSLLMIHTTETEGTKISSPSKQTTNNILKTKNFPQQQRNNKIDLAKEKELADFNIERTIKKSQVQWATIDGKNAVITTNKQGDNMRENLNARQAAFEGQSWETDGGFYNSFEFTKYLDDKYSYDLDTYSFTDSEGSMYDIAFVGEWSVTVCNDEAMTTPSYLYTKSDTHERGDPDYMSSKDLKAGRDCWNARWYGGDELEARMYFDTVNDGEIDFTLRFAGTIISHDMLQISGTFLTEHMNIWADTISGSSELEYVGDKDGVLYFDGVIVVDCLLVGPMSSGSYSFDFEESFPSIEQRDATGNSKKFHW